MKRLFLILGLLFPGMACAQGALYSNVALSAAGRPLGGANVSVCGYPATAGTAGNTCTTLITIYSDKALSVPISQTDPAHPFVTDGFGNYSFWVNPTTCSPSNACTIQVSGPGVTTTLLPFTVGGGGGGGIPAWYLNNVLVGIEPNYDVIPGANTTITATDDAGASRVHYTLNARPSVTVQHNGTFVGTEPIVNLIDGANVTLTVANNVGATRVDATVAASGGGGSGCTVGSLLDQWVMSVHPNATCYGSIDWLWDDTNWNNRQGDGSNTLSGTNTLAFSQGKGNGQTDVTRSWITGEANTHTCDSNTIGTSNCFDFFDIGRLNSITDTGASSSSFFNFVFGQGQTITVTGGSTGFNIMQLLRDNTVQSLAGAHVDDVAQLGKNNSIQASGASSLTSSAFQVGEVETITTSGGADLEDNFQLGEVSTVQATAAGSGGGFMTQIGFNHNFFTSTPGVQMNYGTAIGHANTNSDGSGATTNQTDFIMVGHSLHLVNCSDCFAMGKNIDQSTSNTLYLGMSATDVGLSITNSGGTHDNVRRTPMLFASLPACAAGTEGSFASVTDSTTNTWGATVTGTGSNHIMAFCNGTNWTVMAK